MTPTDPTRPLRVFEKVLGGGLGPGNLGVLMSRHGIGKVAVMTTVALDHALHGINSLHVAVGESVSDIRAYDDEVLRGMLESVPVVERLELMSRAERHRQIYTYRTGDLSPKRLRRTVEFLGEHAEFRPGLIEIQGWPDFKSVDPGELRALKGIAVEYGAEIWLSCHIHRSDVEAGQPIPPFLSRLEDLVSVLVGLEAEADRVHLKFLRVHGQPPAEGVHLEFDPKTMQIRWR